MFLQKSCLPVRLTGREIITIPTEVLARSFFQDFCIWLAWQINRREARALWKDGFGTFDISNQTGLPEHIIHKHLCSPGEAAS